MNIRTGFGYDVHQLAEGYEFWLGGIQIDHNKGAVGHSDADVLIHVICDAFLGAANLRDIGFHFPDTDEAFKGIDSKKLLFKTMELIRGKGWEPVNIDSTVVLQRPKISLHVPSMIQCLTDVMNIDEDRLSIKATTNEKIGFIGREEGVAAFASVLICKE